MPNPLMKPFCWKNNRGDDVRPILAFLLIFMLTTLSGFAADKSAKTVKPAKPKKTYFAYRSFNAELETTRQFAEIGVDVRCFFAANTINSLGTPYCEYPMIWLGTNRYDFTALDAQVSDLIKANPKAKFLCMIDLNTPPWGTRRHSFDSYTVISHAVCSPNWKKDAAKWLNDFLDYSEKKYGDRIEAYILSGGGTSEWYEYDRGYTSRIKDSTWRIWCKNRGLDFGNEVPASSSLQKATLEDVVYDPATELNKIKYWQFHNEMIVTAMLEFASQTRKKISVDKEIGYFFGYYLVSDTKLTSFGHLDYERLYASPDVDFFISPQTYKDREIGGGSGPQLVQGTLARYGKRYLSEIDHSTHVTKNWFITWKNRAEDFAGIKREIAYAMINHSSLWIFDMWGGRYAEPETRLLVGDLKKVFDRYVDDSSPSAAEVLMIADPQSAYYLNEKKPHSAVMTTAFRDKLNRIGTPFDVYSFSDIPYINMKQYKMVCLPATVCITPEREAILRKHVFCDNKTVVWVYAPGVVDGKSLDTERVKKWAGVPYKTTGPVITPMGGWNAFYAWEFKSVTPTVLRDTAKKAGVHLYTDEENPVYANTKMFAVHFKKGGNKTIHLPRKCKKVIDLFTSKTVAENTDEFTYDFADPDTVLFEMQ